MVGGELAVEEPPEFNAAHDPTATAATLAAGRPTTVYAIDVFERIAVPRDAVDRLTASDQPVARLAGELLTVRRGQLIGDAGALVLLTHPHLFRVERRRLGWVGDHLTETDDGTLVDVVIDVDAPAVASVFVEAIRAA